MEEIMFLKVVLVMIGILFVSFLMGIKRDSEKQIWGSLVLLAIVAVVMWGVSEWEDRHIDETETVVGEWTLENYETCEQCENVFKMTKFSDQNEIFHILGREYVDIEKPIIQKIHVREEYIGGLFDGTIKEYFYGRLLIPAECEVIEKEEEFTWIKK